MSQWRAGDLEVDNRITDPADRYFRTLTILKNLENQVLDLLKKKHVFEKDIFNAKAVIESLQGIKDTFEEELKEVVKELL